MGTDVVIRRATVEDAEGVVRANEASWNAAMAPVIDKELEELMPFDDRVARYRDGMATAPAGVGVWVADRGGTIVGHASVAVEEGVAELRGLYVVPDEWGSGVAGALHDAALAGIRDMGATKAVLWVVDQNTRARRFYERHGWTVDGETKASMFDVTEVRYSRSL